MSTTRNQDAGSEPTRAGREIAHSRMLAQGDTEALWGWSTPAGSLRAERRAALIVAGARIGPNHRVLEIGCGTGMFTEKFARAGTHIVAVDISSDLLAKARQRELPPSQVTFLEKRFEDADIDGPFDAVIGSSILHHLDVEQALLRIHSLLKPGGHMCFAEPNLLNPQVWMERRFHHWKMFSYTSPDEIAFVRGKLDRQLENAGFVERRIEPFDWLHPGTPPRAIPWVSRLGALLERLPLIRSFAGSLHICARRPPEAQGS